MYGPHAENLLIPVEQELQVPREQAKVLQFRVEYCLGVKHQIFLCEPRTILSFVSLHRHEVNVTNSA